MMTHEQIRQIAENTRDCCDKERALGCRECRLRHRDGYMRCRDSAGLMVAEAIEQLLEEAERRLKEGNAMNAADADKALEWLEGYTLTDTKQVYTNGTVLVPLFRVRQALKDKAYNGLMEG